MSLCIKDATWLLLRFVFYSRSWYPLIVKADCRSLPLKSTDYVCPVCWRRLVWGEGTSCVEHACWIQSAQPPVESLLREQTHFLRNLTSIDPFYHYEICD